jgi:hypothetical protein
MQRMTTRKIELDFDSEVSRFESSCALHKQYIPCTKFVHAKHWHI